MKDRVLKLLKKMARQGDQSAKFCYVVWNNQNTRKQELKRDGECNKWNYYDWAHMKIHHNIETDKIIVFIDSNKWEEE